MSTAVAVGHAPSTPPPLAPSAFVPAPPNSYGPAPSSKSGSPAKTVLKLLLCVVAALFAYGVVVGVHMARDPYSSVNQDEFVKGCTDAGSPESTCRCEIDWIKQSVPAADYKAYAQAVHTLGADAAPRPPWVIQAITSCAGAPTG